ncbi:MAG: hypothetical protein BGO01_17645 [Armatimonadetes bacterium 55-13]|nr:hypothetical protein [Armatimonadota bacterium]OJU63967.1 MAG: hypothetical protein BGO01_17645 [Armatimonadetes bacterium 55-13]
MKKRKPPIVLGTLLVIMVIATAIIYKPQGAPGDHDHEQEQPAANQPEPERPKMTPQQAAGINSSAMKTSAAPGSPQRAMPTRPGEESNEPSIAVPKQQNYKPKPNDSSISTQWYNEETRK